MIIAETPTIAQLGALVQKAREIADSAGMYGVRGTSIPQALAIRARHRRPEPDYGDSLTPAWPPRRQRPSFELFSRTVPLKVPAATCLRPSRGGFGCR